MKKFALLLVLVFGVGVSWGQVELARSEDEVNFEIPDFLPPSPDVASLGEHGNIPLNMSTGTPNVSINLYNFVGKKLSLPITLSYASNGIKVDQIASNVGMGWAISANWSINRVIRGKPDESSYATPDFPHPISTSTTEGLNYILNTADGQINSEMDMYRFNIPGRSGGFVFDRSGEVVLLPFQNTKVIKGGTDSDGLTSFIIVTPDGIKYYFGIGGVIDQNRTRDMCSRSYSQLSNTAWHLTKIEHPSGEGILLEYLPINYISVAGVTQTITTKGLGNDGQNDGTTRCPISESEITCKKAYDIEGWYLKSITNTYAGSLIFNYSTRQDANTYRIENIDLKGKNGSSISQYLFSYKYSTSNSLSNEFSNADASLKKRLFLSGVKQVAGNLEKQWSFYYDDINGLPPRLSFAQDFFGYANGENNRYFVPKYEPNLNLFKRGADRELNHNYAKKGLLSSITYPTGGRSNLAWEPNDYSGKKEVDGVKKSTQFGQDGANPFATKSQTFADFEATQTVTFEVYVSTAYNPGEKVIDDPEQSFASLKIFNNSGYQVLSIPRVELGERITKSLTVSKGKAYSVEILVSGSTIRGNVSWDWWEKFPKTVVANLPTGGLRIKSISNDYGLDSETNKIYKYVSRDNPSASSAEAYFKPPYYGAFYGSYIVRVPTTNFGFIECGYLQMFSDSRLDLAGFGGSHIGYKSVLEYTDINGTNGFVENKFRVTRNSSASPVVGKEYHSNFTNNKWGNGVLNERSFYAKSTYKKGDVEKDTFIIISNEKYKYTIAHLKRVRNLTAHKFFKPNCTLSLLALKKA
jgi:hypothetical protein